MDELIEEIERQLGDARMQLSEYGDQRAELDARFGEVERRVEGLVRLMELATGAR
jgi:archaellum component FlaC